MKKKGTPRVVRTPRTLYFYDLPYHVSSWEEWIRVLTPIYHFEPNDLQRSIQIQHPVHDLPLPHPDIDRVFQCMVLVRSDHTQSLKRFPKASFQAMVTPEDVVNAILPLTTTWHDVHPVRRFFLPRLTTYFDPEFMMLAWMVQLENYDTNCRALIPSYPKTIYNVRLEPQEIIHVVEMYKYRLTLWRSVMAPDFHGTVDELLRRLCYPLAWLCTTSLGKAVLTFVHDMLSYVDRDPSQHLFETRFHLWTHLLTFLKTHSVLFRYGVAFFHGMPNPMIRVETLLAQGLLLESIWYHAPLIEQTKTPATTIRMQQAYQLYEATCWDPAICLRQADLSPRGEPVSRCVRSHYLDMTLCPNLPTSARRLLRSLHKIDDPYYRQLMLQPFFSRRTSTTRQHYESLLTRLTVFTNDEKRQHRAALIKSLQDHETIVRRLSQH